ncbi:hypothetical protein, partial [Escherichia coli]|uniref:hypothetical protein n=1 Tax=Escherichia coli TaxID=562 RepID=UPI0013867E54
TKSVTTTLTGIAVGQGAFTGMSQTLASIFDGRAMAHLDERKRRLTWLAAVVIVVVMLGLAGLRGWQGAHAPGAVASAARH